MIENNATDLAKKLGAVGVEPFDLEWRGSSVYRLIPFEGWKNMCLGTPILILANEVEARKATQEETFLIMQAEASSIRYEDD